MWLTRHCSRYGRDWCLPVPNSASICVLTTSKGSKPDNRAEFLKIHPLYFGPHISGGAPSSRGGYAATINLTRNMSRSQLLLEMSLKQARDACLGLPKHRYNEGLTRLVRGEIMSARHNFRNGIFAGAVAVAALLPTAAFTQSTVSRTIANGQGVLPASVVSQFDSEFGNPIVVGKQPIRSRYRNN